MKTVTGPMTTMPAAAQAEEQREDARLAEARRQKMLNAVYPTAEEDAAITAAAMSDPDALPLTDEQLAEFKPARRPRGRPAQDATKVPMTMRLDNDVLDSFRATGDGWQTRINAALRGYLIEHNMLARRYHATVHGYTNEPEQLAAFLVVASDEGTARAKVKQHLLGRGLEEAARGEVVTVDVGNARTADLKVIY